MTAYDLPTSLPVGGVEYKIRYGWRSVLDALVACADTELDNQSKAYCLLKIMFHKMEEIPLELHAEACEKVCDFIDCGQRNEGKPKPKLIDWQADAAVIIPEVNKIAGREVRLDPDIHWWTFFGWFMGIGDGLLASVLHIRAKKANGKKLEKWEQDFYVSNKALIDMKSPESEEIKSEKANILKWL